MRHRPPFFALMFGVPAAFALWPQAACAQSAASAYESPAREELILEVVMGRHRMADAVIVMQLRDRYYLPVITLGNIMDFQMDAEPRRGFVSGNMGVDAPAFGIDRDKGIVTYDGVDHALSPDALMDAGEDGEIYVLLETVQKMWPGVRFSVDLSMLQLQVASERTLPFEEKLERDGKRDAVLKGQARLRKPDLSTLTPIRNDYKLFSLPFIDIEGEAGYRVKPGKGSGRVNLHGRHDLGYMSADYTASFTHDDTRRGGQPHNVRLRLERQAFGDDAMPLGIRNVQAGDVRLPLPGLIDAGDNGRGVTLSSRTNVREGDFDLITVEGTGQPGWEVELYRNGELIDFGTVADNGEYRFEDVEIGVGNNQIRIVLYGPQGQVAEDVRQYMIGAGMVKPGEHEYRFGLVDSGKPLIPINHESSSDPDGIAANGYFARGINRFLTAFGTITRVPTPDDMKKYLSVGAMMNVFNSYAQVEAYKETGGGEALDTRIATNIDNVRLNARASVYDLFESPDADYGNNAKKFEAEARALTNISLPFGMLGLQVDGLHTRNRAEQDFTRYSTRQSLGRAGFRLTHETDTFLLDNAHQSSLGTIGVNSRIDDWQLRGGLQYGIFPDTDLVSAQSELRYRSPHDFSAALRARHFFEDSSSAFGGQLGYDFGSFLGSIDADWYENEGTEIFLRASTSLGPIGPDRSYLFSSQRLSAFTPLSARIFMDRDNDGSYGEGDVPMEGAALLSGYRHFSERSDADGRVHIMNAGIEGPAPFMVDGGTLQDPSYQQDGPGYAVMLRPGSVAHIDVPVVETGVIDGTVYADGAPVSGLALNLLNGEGAVIQSVHSAYDGYYSFEFVPRGEYSIQADPAYLYDIEAEKVRLHGDDLFKFGVDLAARKKAP